MAAIALKDKLVSSYEPCIFAALNSAKVMLAVGTKPEFFSSVCVKNDWSRFLKMMNNDRTKVLIPCYKDMEAYELPEEFSHLQAQDMGKISFIIDIVRSISKVINKAEPSSPPKQTETSVSAVAPLIERVFLFLEDCDWQNASSYCERVLDQDPKNAYAYLGKLMADLKVTNRSDLASLSEPFGTNGNYSKLIRFADPELRSEIEGYLNQVQSNFDKSKASAAYEDAKTSLPKAETGTGFFAAAGQFNAPDENKDAIHTEAKRMTDNAASKAETDKAAQMPSNISNYSDAGKSAGKCKEEGKNSFDRYTVLVANFRALSQGANGVSREQQIRNEIDRLSSEKDQLTRLTASFPTDSRELDSTEAEIKSRIEKISTLQATRASLGLFAGKQKKEIDSYAYVLQTEIDSLNAKAAQLKNTLRGYSSVDEINIKIVQTQEQIVKLQTELDEVEAGSVQLGSLDDVIHELMSADIFRFVIKDTSVLNELLQNPAVLKSVMNDTALVSKLYGVKLPQNIIDALEGTDDKLYYVHKNDLRTEAQTVADFEMYFANELFAGYEIARNVEPAYFGAHPKCKPIQFLFRKNGKDVLAVAVLKYSSVSHPAVSSVKTACNNRGLPYLRFIVGYPNKEHYVVRRTLEELGEIARLYAD